MGVRGVHGVVCVCSSQECGNAWPPLVLPTLTSSAQQGYTPSTLPQQGHPGQAGTPPGAPSV